jgi:hypothetical protein
MAHRQIARKECRNEGLRPKQLLLRLLHRFRYFTPAATCQSGYGAVCKTAYPGSIPGVASSPLEIIGTFATGCAVMQPVLRLLLQPALQPDESNVFGWPLRPFLRPPPVRSSTKAPARSNKRSLGLKVREDINRGQEIGQPRLLCFLQIVTCHSPPFLRPTASCVNGTKSRPCVCDRAPSWTIWHGGSWGNSHHLALATGCA